MAKIELKDISHSYEIDACENIPAECDAESGFVLKNMNITWEEGTANALLGPSGCGKTTILNIISGLLVPTMGKILFDGKDVTTLTPEKRHIAQVFQFPVVYDTMSVYNNLAFPLRNAGFPKKDVKRKIEEVSEILDLADVLHTSAGKISQADKQKVSLGRGIIREDTVAILLDEPLTVIDPKEKYILRRKLKEVQKQLKLTTIYVTHDQHEALTFADNVTVLKDGQVVQTGSPQDLHDEPESPFIGYFIGSPGMNLLDCKINGNRLDFRDCFITISETMKAKLAPQGPDFVLGIRPEFVEVSAGEQENSISLVSEMIENVGSHKILTLSARGIKIKCRANEEMRISTGERAWVKFPEKNMKIFKNEERVH